MWKEFKEFALKGSVLDLAIGIIIGAAFSPIVKSLVDDIIMPPIGMLMGGVDFTDKFALLSQGEPAGPYLTLEAARAAGAVTINYGIFINTIITFFIVAFAVFLMVKAINKMRREEETTEEPTTKQCPLCQSTIDIKATRCAFCTSDLRGATAG